MATETKTITYEKCCRTCLKEDILMFDLFMETVESPNIIADILVSCAKLQIHKDDLLPKQICRYCYNNLISFSHFCNMAQKAEEKLKETMLSGNGLNQNHINFEQNCIGLDKNDSNELKFEIKNENDDDCIILIETHKENFETENHESLDEQHSSNVPNSDCKFDKIETEKTKLNCLYCKKQFSKLSKLNRHQEKHLIKYRKQCKFHTLDYSKNDAALTNVGNPDLNIKNTNWICVICSWRFESMKSLSAHMKIHERKGVESINPVVPKENVNTNIILNNNICELKNQFQCEKCLSTFKNINSLSAHMRKHTEKGRIISCKECNKVFKKVSHLKRHEIKHEINCPFKCNMCTKSFPTENVLKEHVNKHRGVKPHRCPVCEKKFTHLSTLTTHIKTHTREKSFLCPTCGKKFDTSTNLNQHQLRHTGLKEFACKLCPQKFVSKGELKSHTVTHTGERSYTCDQCGATFTMRSSLTKHSTRHSGLKPYQCVTCLMRFTCKDHLKRHYRIHTGEKPYKCEMCERAFTQSNDLVKHRRSHLGDKVYKCSQCPESFRFHAELRMHISEHFISSQNMQSANSSSQPSTDGVAIKEPPVQSFFLPPRDGDCSNEFVLPAAQTAVTKNTDIQVKPVVSKLNDLAVI